MDNKEIKIHIWELPEKVNDIDKSKEYFIIYDSDLKKIRAEKIYDFFIQNYKMENLAQVIEEKIIDFSDEYNSKYIELDLSIDRYEEWVRELSAKFKDNHDRIIKIEMSMKDIINSNNNMNELLIDINKRCILLEVFFKDNSDIIDENILSGSNDNENLEELKTKVNELLNTSSQISTNNDMIKEQISSIKKNTQEDILDKSISLKNRIESEYDRIVSIIDYYHHIHSL